MTQPLSDVARTRRATPDDAPAIAQFGERTFRATFARFNTPRDMDAYVSATYGVERQRCEIADPARAYLLAEVDGALAGFALLQEGRLPACDVGPTPVELARFYVDQPWQGRGVAHVLMRAVEDEARARGGLTLWLGVWEHNERAIRFYERVGFVDIGSQPFVLGTDVQTDRVMARPLVGARPHRARAPATRR